MKTSCVKSFFRWKQWPVAWACLASVLLLSSCLDDDDDDYRYLIPNALVTVKPQADESFFLQLDDSTTLLPVNLQKSPFGSKEVRALVHFEEDREASSGGYDKAVRVYWMDSILTKPMAPDLGDQNDAVYGTDPVEMINDWVTIAEDGYLTLRFRTRWNTVGQRHFVNLLAGRNPSDPYEVEFRHHAFGDIHGEMADGLVAFRLDALPDTQGKTVKLTLKWQSFMGEKKAEFNYCTRRSTHSASRSMTAERCLLRLQ